MPRPHTRGRKSLVKSRKERIPKQVREKCLVKAMMRITERLEQGMTTSQVRRVVREYTRDMPELGRELRALVGMHMLMARAIDYAIATGNRFWRDPTHRETDPTQKISAKEMRATKREAAKPKRRG